LGKGHHVQRDKKDRKNLAKNLKNRFLASYPQNTQWIRPILCFDEADRRHDTVVA
jgi:hypothetical protein